MKSWENLQPHGLEPARFLSPWNSPGKNTGVGCHFLLRKQSKCKACYSRKREVSWKGNSRPSTPVSHDCLIVTARGGVTTWTSLELQWLGLCVSNAGGVGSIPGRGTKVPHATWPKTKPLVIKPQSSQKASAQLQNLPAEYLNTSS